MADETHSERHRLASRFSRMLERAIVNLQGESGLLALREESGAFRVGASKNLSEQALGRVEPLLDEIIPRLARAQAFDVLSEQEGHPAETLANSGQMRYLMLAPLALDDTLSGLLVVFQAQASRHFKEQQLPILDALTTQMASSLQEERLLGQLLREQERGEHLRSSFVSIVTHELQTPLSIIKGYASTMSRPDVTWQPEVLADSFHVIEEEADRLSRLVSDLLEVSQIEAHGIRIEPAQVDVQSLFVRAADRLRIAHRDRPLSLSLDGDPGMIAADPGRVEQVLINLVDNAVRYSASGSPVVIELRATEREVQFSVTDQGIGIPAEEAERIFQRFYRVDNSAARRAKGTGLGLFIVRAIVQAHGGRIWVESTPGQGSTFQVVLPREGGAS